MATVVAVVVVGTIRLFFGPGGEHGRRGGSTFLLFVNDDFLSVPLPIFFLFRDMGGLGVLAGDDVRAISLSSYDDDSDGK